MILSRNQETLLLTLVRKGPAKASELPWPTLNVLKRHGLVRFDRDSVSYTTEGFMTAAGIAVRS